MRSHLHLFAALLLLPMVLLHGARPQEAAAADRVYVVDVEAACDAIARECAVLIKSKGIDWKKVRKAFLKEAKDVETDEEHLALLVRLVARLEDGHASVRRTDMTSEVPYPNRGVRYKGPGRFWCRVG
ncbi:MAG: hypothetical protein P1V36_17005, partial [Planctomycetota bacterium]|nr:hypothetical protein [Planctomycetota bacterium]